MNTWKKVATKQILAHPRIRVYEDIVELPNGELTDYVHFGKGEEACTIIAINSEGLVLVQKEYSYPPNEWLYQFPGGMIEKGELVEDATLRELSEEAGFTGTLRKIGFYYLNNRRSDTKMHVFVCDNLMEKSMDKDAEEEFETYWVSEGNIDKLIRDGEVKTYSILAAWALYRARA